MARWDVYHLKHEAVVSTGITILQLKAGTNYGFEILDAYLTQRGSTVSAQEKIAFVRKTAAATVTAAVAGTHLFKNEPNGPTADLSLGTAATGVIATGEGTDGDVTYEEGFNVLNGWKYIPLPESRIYVPVGGIIGLKFMTAPASQTWQMGITVREQ